MDDGVQRSEWNLALSSLPGSHVLQTWEWGQIKSRFGWVPLYISWRDEQGQIFAMAMILEREIALGGFLRPIRIMYIPKGPVFEWNNRHIRRTILQDLHEIALRREVVFVKIDPDVRVGTGIPGSSTAQENPLCELVERDFVDEGWQYSTEQIQFKNTVILDLLPDPEDLLQRMKQKTRYNIRLAGRKGVRIRKGTIDDIGSLYKMYADTSIRDNFTIREKAYYYTVWSTFIKAGMAEPLIAEVEKQQVAAVIPVNFAEKAWYLYGMSSGKHREKMPNYLLQWQAMLCAKEKGCKIYDLWGAPDEFVEGDSMWGVFRFKEGLGGSVVRHVGAWDLPMRKNFYFFYNRVIPKILALMRRRGRMQTRGSI